ncbi:MAG: HAMP domain-containing protein [Frankiales bacterium]|nr:MAG: HAMP domain-containing protein [Frankiales bacterium]
MTESRTTLRWRLTLVYGAVALAVGLLLLLLSVVLVSSALSAGLLDLPRGLGVRLPDGRILTLEAFQDSLREQALGQLLRRGLLALVLLGALGVAVSYYLAGRVLQPLQDITVAAQRLSAERLDARIDLAGPQDELKQLADTFDDMLARLEAAFEAQRRFVADASHELRTPLAVMRTEVEVALADPDASAEDLREAAVVVRDATVRADRLVDSLLLLAQSERMQGPSVRERVELPEVGAQALAAVAGEIEERGLSVATSWGPAAALGDRGLLERLAGNLVENAVRHNVDGGWLRVDTGVVDGRARLEVSSSGGVIAPGEVAGLFEAFRRHGTARTARRGAGLGLAIVRAVAELHGGTARASARPDGGLVVTVDLPRSP